MRLALVLFAAWLTTFPSDLYKPQVRVVEQKADIEPATTPTRLRASVTFENKLDVPVTSVHLGLLITESQKNFTGVNPVVLYEKGPRNDQPVQPVEKEIAVSLPANGTLTVTFPVDLPAGGPTPGVFLSHVLGYTLGDVSVDTLLPLLNSTSSADQLAACDAMGLLGGSDHRVLARQRWQDKAHLRDELQNVLKAPGTSPPTQADAFGRVYAALALGVLGGSEVEHTLEMVADDPNIAELDGPMQVLQRAREAGSPQQTPLAFAVPADAQHFTQVLQIAQRNANSGSTLAGNAA